MPQAMFILAIIAAYYRFWKDWRGHGMFAEFKRSYFDFSLILFIVLISSLNFVFGHGLEGTFEQNVPGFIMMPFTFFIALSLRKNDLKVFIIMAFIESLVIYLEYALGISTFFSSLSRYSEIGSSDLLYYNKPLGLSYNSSIAAAKMLLALMLLDLLRIKKVWTLLLQLGFAVAIFMTFNRTVFVAVFVYLFFSACKVVFMKKYTLARWHVIVFTALILIVGSGIFLIENLDQIISQVTRSTGTLEFSGRDRIWRYFLDFIRENPLFGNHGEKYYYGKYHAHNSYIQLIATHGILISLLYFYFVLRNVRMSNFIFVLTILVYSTFQYGIFWGISVMDVFFYFFLLKLGKSQMAVSETSKQS